MIGGMILPGKFTLLCLLPVLIYLFRWVYKRIFVADGNFKADHVRHKKPAADVWLSPGGGMIPEVQEYMTFLRDAIERLTVCLFSSIRCAGAGAGAALFLK